MKGCNRRTSIKDYSVDEQQVYKQDDMFTEKRDRVIYILYNTYVIL